MLFPLAQPAPAILALADGTTFTGYSIGADGQTTGEVVFNTAMSGYQEILTDPSYSQQIVALTYPHIGNTGVNPEDVESERIQVAGLIVKDVPHVMSSFRATMSLPDYLRAENIVAIAGIDTRKLTRILREKGSLGGAIVTGTDKTKALELARSARSLAGLDLASEISTKVPYEWTQAQWRLGEGYAEMPETKFHVVAFDYGVKRNILRMLAERGCRITVLPAQSTAEDALSYSPDGFFLSNGPGDPEPCVYAIDATRELIKHGKPVFGICFGHQIIGLASGARTTKMKFGHHGANHPVKDMDTGKVLITSQNHNFEVAAESLPSTCRATHVSLFDNSLQGLERTDQPAFSFQGHPEASPGPGDVAYLFDRFISMMEQARQK